MTNLKTSYRWGIPCLLILILIIAVLQQIWFGKNGYIDRQKRQLRVKALAEKEDKMTSRRQHLIQHVEKLKYWDDALESTARETLSMVKKGETFYEFKFQGKDSKRSN